MSEETDPKTSEEQSEYPKPSEIEPFLTTLLELQGPKLPNGLVAGVDNLTFQFRRWRLKEEKEIAKIKEQKGLTLGQYVTEVLAYMLVQLGDSANFEKKKPGEKTLALNQLYLSDVLYMYVYLRYLVDKDYDIPMVCPIDKENFTFTADLNSVEVHIVEKPMELVWDFETRDGMEVRGKTYKMLKIRAPAWRVFSNVPIEDDINDTIAMAAIMKGSILSLDGEEIAMTDEEFDEALGKYDFERLKAFLALRFGGPILAVKVKCPGPGCKTELFGTIKWTDPDFLSISSKEMIGRG